MTYWGSKEIALLCVDFKIFSFIEHDLKEKYTRVG